MNMALILVLHAGIINREANRMKSNLINKY